ncbi:MAG TPA: serine protease [Solirubrobacteraceae bacterium]|nr:serine protease [Solirubrobacteraceae bacterium]
MRARGRLAHVRSLVRVSTLGCAMAVALGGTGASATTVTPRIVNGTTTPIVDAPFQVALFVPGLVSPEEPNNLLAAQFCGGVIRDATHVITAAHCVTLDGEEALAPEEVEVLAGSANLKAPEAGAERDAVVKTSFDPEWNPLTGEHDVGVLTLEKPLWTGEAPEIDGSSTKIAPLAFAGGFPSPGSSATVSGWGFDKALLPEQEPTQKEETEGHPALLQSAEVSILLPAECAADYDEDNLLRSDFICATGAGPPVRDACFGDSGGPLFSGTPGSSSDRLLGLVDFGSGCAQSEFPGVYQALIGDNLFFAQSDPPQAPRNLAAPSITGTPEVGHSIACEPGSWQPSGLVFRYLFVRDEVTVLKALTSELSGPSYTIQPADAGERVFCVAIARNGGGVGEAFSDEVAVPSSPVAESGSPPAPAAASAPAGPAVAARQPPTLRLVSARCRRGSCTAIADTGKGAGQAPVRKVEANLSFARRVRCRRHGHSATCARRFARKVRAQRLAGGRFSIIATGLRPGPYTLTLVAIDSAGLRQTHATKVALVLAAPRERR